MMIVIVITKTKIMIKMIIIHHHITTVHGTDYPRETEPVSTTK